jgi:hypothetical protein
VPGPDPDAVSHPASDPPPPPAPHPASDPPPPPAPHPVRPRIARRPPSDRPLLPDITDDERDVGWGDAPAPDEDERLLREVPPHHGS